MSTSDLGMPPVLDARAADERAVLPPETFEMRASFLVGEALEPGAPARVKRAQNFTV